MPFFPILLSFRRARWVPPSTVKGCQACSPSVSIQHAGLFVCSGRAGSGQVFREKIFQDPDTLFPCLGLEIFDVMTSLTLRHVHRAVVLDKGAHMFPQRLTRESL